MAQTPEGKVKAGVKTLLKRLGIWYFMPATGGFGRSGIHDFVCCWKGSFMGIETKAPGQLGRLTPLQQQAHDEVTAAGGFSIVVDSVSALEQALLKYIQEPFA